MNLAIAIGQLFPDADPFGDYIVQDDGAGAYIAQFNLPEPQPTPAELDAAWALWEAGQPARDELAQQQVDAAAFTDLFNWANYTPDQAVAAAHLIANGSSAATLHAAVDAGGNSVPAMRTQIKLLIDDVILMRTIIEEMSKAIVYLRDRTI